MGFFGPNKPYVSNDEFREALSSLRSKNFCKEDIDEIIKIFNSDLNEKERNQWGIDEEEISKNIKWLKENMSKHRLSIERIDALDKILHEKL